MVTRIKRIAQFLFDNAELVAEFLGQSSNFRTVEIDLRVHKTDGIGELDIELQLYDETSGLHDLQNHIIGKERFIQLCKMVNEDSEVIPVPEPEIVRDKL